MLISKLDTGGVRDELFTKIMKISQLDDHKFLKDDSVIFTL
jgi:hypothetical protein